MKRDVHYYAILGLCRACGFTKKNSYLVAYASQFVDDAKINLILYDNPSFAFNHDTVNNKPAFFNMATCHSYFSIKTYNYEAMVNNTIAFHFVPGAIGENFTKKLRCKEESPVILDILKEVSIEDNLIKLGIVLHAYADTFSHQGFSGMLSKVNDIKNCEAKKTSDLGMKDKCIYFLKHIVDEEIFDSIIPAYGHGQAMTFPDYPCMEWSYEYDYSDEFNGSYKKVKIDNKERYKRAFNSIRKYLENYLSNHSQYLDLELKFTNFEVLIETLLFEGTDKKREEKWQTVLIEQGLFNKEERDSIIYQNDQWLKDAFVNYEPQVFNNRVVEGVLADNFSDSNWYQFYLAVNWYKTTFFKYCSEHQLDIPN